MTTRHILIAEKDAALLHGMALLLRQAEFRVCTAAESGEALRLLAALEAAATPVDLVIAGFCRPGNETDRRFLHAVAARNPAVPVIALTDTDDDAQEHRLAGFGCAARVTKPFTAETLMACVRAVLP